MWIQKRTFIFPVISNYTIFKFQHPKFYVDTALFSFLIPWRNSIASAIVELIVMKDFSIFPLNRLGFSPTFSLFSPLNICVVRDSVLDDVVNLVSLKVHL